MSEADRVPMAAPPYGATRWRRFTAVFAVACLILALLITGVLHGNLPVWAALRGEQYIKLSISHVTGYGHGSFPQFFETKDGRRHPVIVAALDQVQVRGVCASSRVSVPFGSVVARMDVPADAPPVRVRALRMAIEEAKVTDLAGTAVNLDHDALAPDGTVRESWPGRLPIDGRNIHLAVHAKIRWVTVQGMRASGIRLKTGTAVKECF